MWENSYLNSRKQWLSGCDPSLGHNCVINRMESNL